MEKQKDTPEDGSNKAIMNGGSRKKLPIDLFAQIKHAYPLLVDWLIEKHVDTLLFEIVLSAWNNGEGTSKEVLNYLEQEVSKMCGVSTMSADDMLHCVRTLQQFVILFGLSPDDREKKINKDANTTQGSLFKVIIQLSEAKPVECRPATFLHKLIVSSERIFAASGDSGLEISSSDDEPISPLQLRDTQKNVILEANEIIEDLINECTRLKKRLADSELQNSTFQNVQTENESLKVLCSTLQLENDKYKVQVTEQEQSLIAISKLVKTMQLARKMTE
ncbi:MAG: hypothetical protein AAB870_00125 [Patescibacteria group bacterium]